jgi:hypothetical protein
MREYFSALVILISVTAQCQTMNVVMDSLTREPIPYVNIWINNEMTGTTSNENGVRENRAQRAPRFCETSYELARAEAT